MVDAAHHKMIQQIFFQTHALCPSIRAENLTWNRGFSTVRSPPRNFPVSESVMIERSVPAPETAAYLSPRPPVPA